MQSKIEKNSQLALALLSWNRKNLTHGSALSEAVIAEKFAPEFVVKANGRTYPANHGNYKEFLDGFRKTIESIDYKIHEIVASEASTVLAMSAQVVRLDRSIDNFEAMLLLSFDERGLVKLWHEVYVKT